MTNATTHLNGDDWDQVFLYGQQQASDDRGPPNINPAPPAAVVSLKPFDRADVAEVIAFSEGENDEEDWIVAGRLKDGRWFALVVGCDYTGWG